MVSVLGLHLSRHKRDRSGGDRLQINGDTRTASVVIGSTSKGSDACRISWSSRQCRMKEPRHCRLRIGPVLRVRPDTNAQDDERHLLDEFKCLDVRYPSTRSKSKGLLAEPRKECLSWFCSHRTERPKEG
jgi:hypothetical protein